MKDLRQYKSREWFAILGGEDRIYVKRDWFGTVMDKNYGVTKGNERLMGDQLTARGEMVEYWSRRNIGVREMVEHWSRRNGGT